MLGVKTSVTPVEITALGAMASKIGEELKQTPGKTSETSIQDFHAPRLLVEDQTWRHDRRPWDNDWGFYIHDNFFHTLLLFSSDGFKCHTHYHDCHIPLYAAVHVLLPSHLGFRLRYVHVCLRLIILFSSSLSLLELHSVTAASPVAFILTWQPFLTASRKLRRSFSSWCFLPATETELSNGSWQISTQLPAAFAQPSQPLGHWCII